MYQYRDRHTPSFTQPVLVNCHPEVDQQLIFGLFTLPLHPDFEASRSTLDKAAGCVAWAELASLNEFIGQPAVSGVQIDIPIIDTVTGDPVVPAALMTLTANISPANMDDTTDGASIAATATTGIGSVPDDDDAPPGF